MILRYTQPLGQCQDKKLCTLSMVFKVTCSIVGIQEMCAECMTETLKSDSGEKLHICDSRARLQCCDYGMGLYFSRDINLSKFWGN